MLRWILLLPFFMLVALMILGAFIVQSFGWIGLVAMLGVAAVFGYVLAKFLPRFLMSAFTAPMRRMGQVLEGATVRVHSFEPTDPPAEMSQFEDFEGEAPSFEEMQQQRKAMDRLDWYTLDVSITPSSSLTGEPETLTGKKWQPDALMVIPADTENNQGSGVFGALASFASGSVGIIAKKLIWDGLEFVPHDGEDIWGIQRLRLDIGLPSGISRIAFLYQMFTRFGDIAVPPHDNPSRRLGDR